MQNLTSLKNLLTEDNLKLLEIKSISLISESSIKPKFYIHFDNDETISFSTPDELKSYIKLELRRLKLNKITKC